MGIQEHLALSEPKTSAECSRQQDKLQSFRRKEYENQRLWEAQAKYYDAAIAGASSYMMKESSPDNASGRLVVDHLVSLRQQLSSQIETSEGWNKLADNEINRLDTLKRGLKTQEKQEDEE